MQVSPTSLTFANAGAPAQSVKVSGLTTERFSLKATEGISATPSSGANDSSFSVTGPGLRAGSPGSITVEAPGQAAIVIPVSVSA